MKRFLGVLTCCLTLVGTADAGFQFSDAAPGGNHNGGKVTNLYTSYDDVNETLLWSYTVDTQQHDGFWLAISPGPNPKNYTNGEIAIFYGDLSNGRLTAYEYNGANNSNSWMNEAYLDSFSVSHVDNGNGSRTVSFVIDVSGINAHKNTNDWSGAAYGSKIGYWFHPLRGSGFTYNGDGTINSFTQGTQGWYDKNNLNTNSWDGFHSVPEPGTAWLLGAALLGGVMIRRRQLRIAGL